MSIWGIFNSYYLEEHLSFQTDNITECASKCAKSREILKVVEDIIRIGTYDQQFIFLECLLQSQELKQKILPSEFTIY